MEDKHKKNYSNHHSFHFIFFIPSLGIMLHSTLHSSYWHNLLLLFFGQIYKVLWNGEERFFLFFTFYFFCWFVRYSIFVSFFHQFFHHSFFLSLANVFVSHTTLYIALFERHVLATDMSVCWVLATIIKCVMIRPHNSHFCLFTFYGPRIKLFWIWWKNCRKAFSTMFFTNGVANLEVEKSLEFYFELRSTWWTLIFIINSNWILKRDYWKFYYT